MFDQRCSNENDSNENGSNKNEHSPNVVNLDSVENARQHLVQIKLQDIEEKLPKFIVENPESNSNNRASGKRTDETQFRISERNSDLGVLFVKKTPEGDLYAGRISYSENPSTDLIKLSKVNKIVVLPHPSTQFSDFSRVKKYCSRCNNNLNEVM